MLEAVGDRATVVAGVGTNDTAHTCELARAAERAGAHGLLVVTPYYNKPPQSGLVAHFTPGGRRHRPAEHAVRHPRPHRHADRGRDADPARRASADRGGQGRQGDFGAASRVMNSTPLVFYSGDDMLNLPWLSLGAAGFVSVVGHVVGERLHEMIDAYRAGQVAEALRLHRELLPVYTGLFRNQGVIMTKAALGLLGLPGGPVRLPLSNATDAGDRAAADRSCRGRCEAQVSHPHPELGAPPPLAR